MASWICLCTLVYLAHHATGKQARLASCAAYLDPPAVSPSKWVKAEHVGRQLLSCIYIWSGRGKCPKIFCQGEANQGALSLIQSALVHCMLKCVPSLWKNMSFLFCDQKKYMAGEHMEIMRVSSVLPGKQENGCLDKTMLHCKILCELKGNDCSVEREFPILNSGCFHRRNVNCAARTLKQMPRWSRKPR